MMMMMMVVVMSVCLLDMVIGTILRNISVYKGPSYNTTVIYNLTEPYTGLRVNNFTIVPLTPEEKVTSRRGYLKSHLFGI